MADVAIDIKGITKQFPRTKACDDITLQFPKGGIYGLLGPNGAGKTTLFSIVAGFLRATSGQIEVLGVNTHRISDLRGRLTILPQDAQFAANVPVIEQIIFFSQLNGKNRAEAEKDAADALALVGLADAAKASANTLSHGMYKRVGIAQAFLGTPEVILLDEPTAGLDPASAQGIRDLITKLHKSGVTLIVSSHNLAEIQKMCEAVAILDKGKLVTWSKVKDLTQADTVIRITFGRPLAQPEIDNVKAVVGVRDVERDGPVSYRIHIDHSAKSLEQYQAEIVGKLVVTGAIPRQIEDGVALETKYLELTKAKDNAIVKPDEPMKHDEPKAAAKKEEPKAAAKKEEPKAEEPKAQAKADPGEAKADPGEAKAKDEEPAPAFWAEGAKDELKDPATTSLSPDSPKPSTPKDPPAA